MTTLPVRTTTYEYSHTVGIDDFSGRSFRYAVDLALGQGDVLYVLQRGVAMQRNLGVKICSVDEEYFGEFGVYGTGQGEWMWPAGIATDSQEQVYVSDEWNQRISVFDSKGVFLKEWGEFGAGPGQINRPSGLAFDPQGHLLIVDTLNHRIQRFTKDGEYIDGWGGCGDGPGRFNMPWGIAVSSGGEVFVADWRNDRVQKFNPGGQFMAEWGHSGKGQSEFDRPVGIAVDQSGDVYVVDSHNHRIQIFDGDGVYLAQLTGDSTMSTWAEQLMAANPLMVEQRRVAKDLDREKGFWNPRGICVDDKGRIIVVDSGRGRLQVYRKLQYEKIGDSGVKG